MVEVALALILIPVVMSAAIGFSYHQGKREGFKSRKGLNADLTFNDNPTFKEEVLKAAEVRINEESSECIKQIEEQFRKGYLTVVDYIYYYKLTSGAKNKVIEHFTALGCKVDHSFKEEKAVITVYIKNE